MALCVIQAYLLLDAVSCESDWKTRAVACARSVRRSNLSSVKTVLAVHFDSHISGRESAGRARAANIGATPGFSCAGERRILPEPIRGNYGVKNRRRFLVKHAFMQKRPNWHCLMGQCRAMRHLFDNLSTELEVTRPEGAGKHE
jgi:hypothetical protein